MAPIYGDTEGTLESRAKAQTLTGTDGETNYIYGDAEVIFYRQGGNDKITGGINAIGNYLFGDAYSLNYGQGGNDVLTGGTNSIRNILYGDAYEIYDSQGGNDILTGGASSEINGLFGDAQQMSGSRGGNDVLTGGNYSNNNVLYGDADSMLDSQGGNDVLTGGANDGFQYNLLLGDARQMENSQGGNDVLRGGSSSFSNFLFGDALSMFYSQGGNDVLTGDANSYFNELYGDAFQIAFSRCGSDILIASASPSSSTFVANNKLYGDAKNYAGGDVLCGNDRLVSGTGNDDMWGDIAYSGDGSSPIDLTRVTTGHDVFVFAANNGNDTIHDFRQGEDKIELQGVGVASFDELMGGFHLSQDTANTVITFGSNTITVIGVTELTAADFLFT